VHVEDQTVAAHAELEQRVGDWIARGGGVNKP